MNKIRIKLKECCLTCEDFDPSGIKGFGAYIACCGELERVIACGHMKVCAKYNGKDAAESSWTRIEHTTDDLGRKMIEWKCNKCGGRADYKTKFCPFCGARNKG